jgi:hypothetical protein
LTFDPETGEVQDTLEPAQVVQLLNKRARGLHALGVELARISDDLSPVARRYADFVDNFTAGLWEKHEAGEIKRWPGEDARAQLARQAMPTELRGEHARLGDEKDRCVKAISRARSEIDAYRSILSAMKEGLVQ